MTTPSDATGPTPQTPEEIRREMKGRFDAVNTEAEARHARSRDAGNLAASEENKRWVRPESGPDLDNDTTAENQPD
jgi:hypothetical protein